MKFILEGFVLGLTLTILLGPIFIALTQTGISRGIRAGITVGAGIWSSDLLVILTSYYFIHQLNELTHNKQFHFWMGLAGGLVLIIFGLVAIFKKPEINDNIPDFNATTFVGYWTKGFIVNFFNPFTFIFWIGVMTTFVIGKETTGWETFLLFGSIMVTIMVTDSMKVVMAKLIKSKMKPDQIFIFGRIAGIILCIFGILLLIKSNII